MLLLYSHFSKKSLQFANFYHSVFRCKILRPFDLAVTLDKGREETFAVSLQNRKSCIFIKYLTLFRPRPVNFVFYFLYSM